MAIHKRRRQLRGGWVKISSKTAYLLTTMTGCQKSGKIIVRRFLWKAPKYKPHRSKSVLVRGMILGCIHIPKRF